MFDKNRYKSSRFLLLSLTFLSCHLFSAVLPAAGPGAGQASAFKQQQEQASESQITAIATLVDHPQWQALLHINKGSTFGGRGQSYVDDDAFFLADDGKRDSASELRASIAALREPDAKARCQFPARYEFLASQLGWPQDSGLQHCDEFQEWKAQIPKARVVLVFPASYLNSPSSMFGHTLMRLDHTENPDSVWQSWAINFGAVTSSEDNSIFYIYRGLAGGYPGRFNIVPYVKKVQEYSHLENRDIWEYTLDFTEQETERLLNHLWELKDINFDYYFFDENCSFRLLELIDVARPGTDVMAGLRVAEAPVNTVRTAERIGLISEKVFRPSKAAELEWQAQQLNREQQKLAARIAADVEELNSPAYQSLAPDIKHQVALVAYQALRFRTRKYQRTDEVAQAGFRLLKEINANPALEVAAIDAPAPPEAGHGSQVLTLGGGQRENLDYGQIGYRFTYHDLIDRTPGFLKGAQIEGINLQLRSTESDDLKLQRLDVVHIRSHSPRSVLVKPISWFVHGGIERTLIGSRERLARFVQGGPGLTWNAGNIMPYGFLTARLENNSVYGPLLQAGAGAQAGALWYGDKLNLDIGGKGTYFGNDDYRYRYFSAANYSLSRQHALRVDIWWDKTRTEVQNGWFERHERGFGLSWRYFVD